MFSTHGSMQCKATQRPIAVNLPWPLQQHDLHEHPHHEDDNRNGTDGRHCRNGSLQQKKTSCVSTALIEALRGPLTVTLTYKVQALFACEVESLRTDRACTTEPLGVRGCYLEHEACPACYPALGEPHCCCCCCCYSKLRAYRADFCVRQGPTAVLYAPGRLLNCGW
jgi:hypothetical protein